MLPLWDDAPRRRPAVVTMLLIAINISVFIYEAMLAGEGGGRALSAFITQNALVPGRLLKGYGDEQQWLTVLSAMFLHGGVAHVAGNCWFLWVFGKNVEDRLGSILFLLFYVVCGVAAAALQVAMDPFTTIPMLGASGAISGVMGAFLVLFPTAWVFTLVPWIVPIVPLPAFVLLIVWFALQMLNGVGSLTDDAAVNGGVAWWAHAGGFAGGFLLVVWLRKLKWVRRG